MSSCSPACKSGQLCVLGQCISTESACCPGDGIAYETGDGDIVQFSEDKQGKLVTEECELITTNDQKCIGSEKESLTVPWTFTEPMCDPAGEIFREVCGAAHDHWVKMVPWWMWVIVGLIALGMIISTIVAIPELAPGGGKSAFIAITVIILVAVGILGGVGGTNGFEKGPRSSGGGNPQKMFLQGYRAAQYEQQKVDVPTVKSSEEVITTKVLSPPAGSDTNSYGCGSCSRGPFHPRPRDM